MKKLRLAVFISGRGSNMAALIEACQQHDFPAEIALVLSNRPEAEGLQKAQAAGLETAIIDHKEFADKAAFEAALLAALSGRNIDLICLAGFMRLLSGEFLRHYPERVINIHPSLLPDYKGLHTHERVLEDGKDETGCTVHIVTAEMDGGPVLVQKKVPVMAGDTPNDLAARVLTQEHLAYPQAVRMMAKRLT